MSGEESRTPVEGTVSLTPVAQFLPAPSCTEPSSSFASSDSPLDVTSDAPVQKRKRSPSPSSSRSASASNSDENNKRSRTESQASPENGAEQSVQPVVRRANTTQEGNGSSVIPQEVSSAVNQTSGNVELQQEIDVIRQDRLKV